MENTSKGYENASEPSYNSTTFSEHTDTPNVVANTEVAFDAKVDISKNSTNTTSCNVTSSDESLTTNTPANQTSLVETTDSGGFNTNAYTNKGNRCTKCSEFHRFFFFQIQPTTLR